MGMWRAQQMPASSNSCVLWCTLTSTAQFMSTVTPCSFSHDTFVAKLALPRKRRGATSVGAPLPKKVGMNNASTGVFSYTRKSESEHTPTSSRMACTRVSLGKYDATLSSSLLTPLSQPLELLQPLLPTLTLSGESVHRGVTEPGGEPRKNKDAVGVHTLTLEAAAAPAAPATPTPLPLLVQRSSMSAGALTRTEGGRDALVALTHEEAATTSPARALLRTPSVLPVATG